MTSDCGCLIVPRSRRVPLTICPSLIAQHRDGTSARILTSNPPRPPHDTGPEPVEVVARHEPAYT